MLVIFVFFFFKQKTAYGMRISDWMSDVCASDLQVCAAAAQMVPYEPGIMDELDPVKALAVYIEGLGAPESIRRDAEDVKQLRAAKAKAAEQAQQQAMVQQAQGAGMEEAAKAAGAQVAA